jgi:excisionase family DNA binding protein
MPKTALARTPLVEDRLYTREEAAEVLNVTLRFVTRCVQERRIRYVRVGRMVRIPASSLADYLSENAVSTKGN